jgi:hypothetical protein
MMFLQYVFFSFQLFCCTFPLLISIPRGWNLNILKGGLSFLIKVQIFIDKYNLDFHIECVRGEDKFISITQIVRETFFLQR